VEFGERMGGTQTSREAMGCADTSENSDSPARRKLRRCVQTSILIIESTEQMDEWLDWQKGLQASGLI